MTGSGVNDAPALSCANVITAVESATDAGYGAAGPYRTRSLHHRPRHPQILYHLPAYAQLLDVRLHCHYPYRCLRIIRASRCESHERALRLLFISG